MKYVCDQILNSKAKNVLDVGCGDGRLCSILFNQYGIKELKGIDLSEKAVGWAKLFNPDIEFDAIDVKDESKTWDAIACVEVIEHIPDDMLSEFFNQLKNKLSYEGKIFITVPSIYLPMQSKHYRHYTVELLMQQLLESKCGLKIVEWHYIDPPKTFLDNIVRKLFYNENLWKCAFYDKFEWKRLWRKGFVSDKGRHLFAIIEPKE